MPTELVGDRIRWFNDKAERVGPALADHNGELDVPVKTCKGCRYFGVHDFHYYYCSEQPAQNQDPQMAGSACYPWRGAGTQFSRWPDARGCPHDTEIK
jgi:hypothetical protein